MLNHTFQGHFLKEVSAKTCPHKGMEKELKFLLRLVNTGSYTIMPPRELGSERIRSGLTVKLSDQSRAEQKYTKLPHRDRMTPRPAGFD